MYKFYFNNQLVSLCESSKLVKNINEALVIHYQNTDQIIALSDLCFEEKLDKPIYIINHDLNYLYDQITSVFKIVTAAGGLVFNEQNEILLIKRSGLWDLPKGKIEKEEKIDEAALREVNEETNLKDIKIVSEVKLPFLHQNRTFHTYKHKGDQVFKITYWYIMKGNSKDELIPQLEEKITKVKWHKFRKAQKKLKKSYLSLQDLLNNYKK